MDDAKKALVPTADMVFKEVNTDMVDKKRKSKPNLVKEAITPPISEKQIYIVNITEKSQAPNKTVACIFKTKADNAISLRIE